MVLDDEGNAALLAALFSLPKPSGHRDAVLRLPPPLAPGHSRYLRLYLTAAPCPGITTGRAGSKFGVGYLGLGREFGVEGDKFGVAYLGKPVIDCGLCSGQRGLIVLPDNNPPIPYADLPSVFAGPLVPKLGRYHPALAGPALGLREFKFEIEDPADFRGRPPAPSLR